MSSNTNNASIDLYLSVVGLSGTSQIKGVYGVGKSSLCNRLVRPEDYLEHQLGSFSSVDFYGDKFGGSHWIYWGASEPHCLEKLNYNSCIFHIVEHTIVIDDHSYQPFDNYSQLNYLDNSFSDVIKGGPKRSYFGEYCTISSEYPVFGFIIAYDVSKVDKRDGLAQETFVTKALCRIMKLKKPFVLVVTKCDRESSEIRGKLGEIIRNINNNKKRGFKSQIIVLESSAHYNINISEILLYFLSVFYSNSTKGAPSPALPLSPTSFHVVKYAEAREKQEISVQSLLTQFHRCIRTQINQHYDVSFNEIYNSIDVYPLLKIIGRGQLKDRFNRYREMILTDIRESILSSYLVLVNKLLYEFVDPYFQRNLQDSAQAIINEIISNQQFLSHFNHSDRSESQIFKRCHLSGSIDYPLPKFLIDRQSRFNKLDNIATYIDELKNQRRKNDLINWFMTKLNNEPIRYMEMNFNQLEAQFSSQHEMWPFFRDDLKEVYQDFIAKQLDQVHGKFNDLMSCNYPMIFNRVSKILQYHKSPTDDHIKTLSDSLPYRNVLESLNNDLVFDNDSFNHSSIVRQSKKKWISEIIESLVWNQCYLLTNHLCGHNTTKLTNGLRYCPNLGCPTDNGNINLIVVSLDSFLDTVLSNLIVNILAKVELSSKENGRNRILKAKFVSYSSINIDGLLISSAFNQLFEKTSYNVLIPLILEGSFDSKENLCQIDNFIELRRILGWNINCVISLLSSNEISKTSDYSFHKKLGKKRRKIPISLNSFVNETVATNILQSCLDNHSHSLWRSFKYPHSIYRIWLVTFCMDNWPEDLLVKLMLHKFDQYQLNAQLPGNDEENFVEVDVKAIYNNRGYHFKVAVLSYHKAYQILMMRSTIQTLNYDASVTYSQFNNNNNNYNIPNLVISICDIATPSSFRCMFAFTSQLNHDRIGGGGCVCQLRCILCVVNCVNNDNNTHNASTLCRHVDHDNSTRVNGVEQLIPIDNDEDDDNYDDDDDDVDDDDDDDDDHLFIDSTTISNSNITQESKVKQYIDSINKSDHINYCMDYIIIEDVSNPDCDQLESLWTSIRMPSIESDICCNDNHGFNNEESPLKVSNGDVRTDISTSAATSSTTLDAVSLSKQNGCGREKTRWIISDSSQDESDTNNHFSTLLFHNTEPLGCFNETKYHAIKEEELIDEACDTTPDISSIIIVHCSNNNHLERTPLVSGKHRSHSGPVCRRSQLCGSSSSSSSSSSTHRISPALAQHSIQMSHITSNSKKQHIPYNPFVRYHGSSSFSLTKGPRTTVAPQSQRPPPLPAYSHSLSSSISINKSSSNDNSPLTSPGTGQSNNANSSNTTSKSFRNMFSRFFSSDRYNNKSAEDKRGIFKKSFKFGQKSSEKKQKNTQPMSCDSFSNQPLMVRSFGTNESDSCKFIDLRKRTKSMSTFKNS